MARLRVEAIGPARQSELASRLDVSRPAVTPRLVALVSRGLVDITPDDSDQRAKNVVITAAGRALLDRAWRGLAEGDDGIESSVDIATLHEQLEQLIANAQRYLGLDSGGSQTTAGGAVAQTPEDAR